MLSVSKLECQKMSGPQKRTKSDFIYCSLCYRLRSRKLDLPLSVCESRQNLNLAEGMKKTGKSHEKKTIVIVHVLSQKVYISWYPLACKAAT